MKYKRKYETIKGGIRAGMDYSIVFGCLNKCSNQNENVMSRVNKQVEKIKKIQISY